MPSKLAGAFFGGFAHGRGQLIGSRILLGIGTACAQIGAASMGKRPSNLRCLELRKGAVPELSHPRIRHYAGSFLNTTYFVGSIFAAWFTFGMVYYPSGGSWAWRIPQLMQALGPIILGLGVWFIPESPRWLMKQGRVQEAQDILARYHANGKLDDPLVQLEIREISQAVEIEKASSSVSWNIFFETAGNRRRFFIIIIMGCATQ